MTDYGTILHSYQNGGYQVTIYSSGTKVREEIESSLAPDLPEQMDLKITNYCDAGCAWCHEQSTPSGLHGDLHQTLKLLSPLRPGTEIAIGGGDPLSHPDFAWFVRSLREMGIVPSVTVNGKHFERHLPLLKELTDEGSLFGVGFSFDNELPSWDYEHLVVHLIAGVHSPRVLDQAIKSHKVLILGYKQFGRGKKLYQIRSDSVQYAINQWYRELPIVARKHHLSFDNLAIEQLQPQRILSSRDIFERQYMGHEGMFSMYIDAVTKTYAVCSYDDTKKEWSNMYDMFGDVRQMSTSRINQS